MVYGTGNGHGKWNDSAKLGMHACMGHGAWSILIEVE